MLIGPNGSLHGGKRDILRNLVLCGRDDEITKAELESWAEVTTGQSDIHTFPGGHSFLFDCTAEVAELLTQNASNEDVAAIAA